MYGYNAEPPIAIPIYTVLPYCVIIQGWVVSVNRRRLGSCYTDVVAGQESWEREDTRIEVEGYKWFGKPRSNQNSRRG